MRKILLAACLAALCLPAAQAAKKDAAKKDAAKKEAVREDAKDGAQGGRYGVFVYSDLCTAENGDIRGQRIVWMRFADGDMLTSEYANGTLGWPRFSARLDSNEKERSVKFIAQAEDLPARVVTMRLSSTGASITVDGDATAAYAAPRRIWLVKDFAKKWPACE